VCTTAMINNFFICFSAVQIYDLSFIYLQIDLYIRVVILT